jgi:hypothetical protein
MARNILLRVWLDILTPSVEELLSLETLFKKSPAIVNHTMILQSIYSPAKMTYTRHDTIVLLNTIKKEGWQEYLSKDTPPSYLK